MFFPRFAFLSFFILFLPFSLCAKKPPEEEALAVRRIVQCFQEEEFDLVEKQVALFWKQFPRSAFRHQVYTLLGDAHFAQKEYSDAVSSYRALPLETLSPSAKRNYLHSLYEIGDAAPLQSLLQILLPRTDEDWEDTSHQLAALYQARIWLEQANSVEFPQKGKLCHGAEELLLKLKGTAYDIQSRVELAKCYQLQEKEDLSADTLSQLAKDDPQRAEEYLYQAAQELSPHDIHRALTLFHQVRCLGKALASSAALQEFRILFELERFEEVLSSYSNIRSIIPPSLLPLFHYYVGHSALLSRRWELVVEEFEPVIELSKNQPELQAFMLEGLISAYLKQEQYEPAIRRAQQFEEWHPQHPQLPAILISKAQAYRSLNKGDLAKHTLDHLCSTFPQKTEACEVLLEKGISFFQEGDPLSARPFFIQVLQKEESLAHSELSRYYLLKNTFLLEQKQPESEWIKHDLEYLAQLDPCEKGIRHSAIVKLAQLHLKEKELEETKTLCLQLLKETPSEEQSLAAHTLLAYALFFQEDYEAFISTAEHIIPHEVDPQKRARLHQQISYAFFKQAESSSSSPSEEQEVFAREKGTEQSHLQQAIQHLFSAFQLAPEALSSPQLLWLANDRYRLVAKSLDELLVRPVEDRDLLKTLREIKHFFSLAFSPFDSFSSQPQLIKKHEKDLLCYGNLLGWMGEEAKQGEILELLSSQQEKNPSWNWKKRAQTLLAKAQWLQKKNLWKRAEETYSTLFSQKAPVDSMILALAKLEKTRISLILLPDEERTLQSENWVSLLKQFEQLKNRRYLQQEPVHFEAALDWVETLDAALSGSERNLQLIQRLERLKESYSETSTFWAKEYHAARREDKEKNLVYQTYMALIDAQLSLLRAQESEDITQQRFLQATAADLFRAVSQEAGLKYPYLQARARRGLDTAESGREFKGPLCFDWVEDRQFQGEER